MQQHGLCCFSVHMVLFSLKASFFHLWTYNWCDFPKSSILSHQFKGHSPRDFFFFPPTVFLNGFLPFDFLKVPYVTRHWLPLSWSSAWISLDVILSSLSTIHNILLINLGFHFLFHCVLGRFATVLWTICLLIKVTARWSCLEIIQGVRGVLKTIKKG